MKIDIFMKLENKSVIITGSGSGIGEAAAYLFAEHGAKLTLAGRREERLADVCAAVTRDGGTATYRVTDVSDPAAVRALVDLSLDEHGPLFGAFNCAGIDGPKASLTDTTDEDWAQILAINLTGTFYLLREEIRALRRNNPIHGSIVNMGSICSVVARKGRSAYNTSRHGVIGLTKTAAIECASEGIRVNAVSPASVRTDIFYRSTKGDKAMEAHYHASHPVGRIAEAREIAQAALWLLSDDASFVVGHNMMVDGAVTAGV